MKRKERILSLVIALFLAINSIPVVYAENSDTLTEDGDNNNTDADTDVETILPTITFHLPEGDGIIRDDDQVWYKNYKELELIVQDEDSGVSNIDVSVNGIEVLEDKNKVVLLKAAVSESEDRKSVV